MFVLCYYRTQKFVPAKDNTIQQYQLFPFSGLQATWRKLQNSKTCYQKFLLLKKINLEELLSLRKSAFTFVKKMLDRSIIIREGLGTVNLLKNSIYSMGIFISPEKPDLFQRFVKE